MPQKPISQDVKNLAFITGGARSGKSAWAESLASGNNYPIIYIATMATDEADPEFIERVARHKDRRPSDWTTMEAPILLSELILSLPDRASICVIDCLSLWLSNLLLRETLPDSEPAAAGKMKILEEKLLTAVETLINDIGRQKNIHFIIVSNETGSGIVPNNRLARLYRDILGSANQAVAKAASQAWLCCAGLPVPLKGNGALHSLHPGTVR